MRKAILTMLLAVVSGSVVAEWVGVGSTVTANIYVDQATIRKSGNLAQIWMLQDYKQAKLFVDTPYLAVTMHYEFDCKKELERSLSFSAYSERMGKGIVVFSDPVRGEWNSFVPESVAEAVWKIACENK